MRMRQGAGLGLEDGRDRGLDALGLGGGDAGGARSSADCAAVRDACSSGDRHRLERAHEGREMGRGTRAAPWCRACRRRDATGGPASPSPSRRATAPAGLVVPAVEPELAASGRQQLDQRPAREALQPRRPFDARAGPQRSLRRRDGESGRAARGAAMRERRHCRSGGGRRASGAAGRAPARP